MPSPLFNVCSPTPSATIGFLTNLLNTSALSSYTFSSVGLGTASSDRWILVGVTCLAGTGVTPAISSLTVNGVSASAVIEFPTTTEYIGFWIANVPSGASGSIVVNYSAGVLNTEIGVWEIHKLVSGTATATMTKVGFGQTISPTQGGCICVGLTLIKAGSAVTVDWTGGDLTESYLDHDATNGMSSSGGSISGGYTSSSLTVSGQFSGGSGQRLVGAIFR